MPINVTHRSADVTLKSATSSRFLKASKSKTVADGVVFTIGTDSGKEGSMILNQDNYEAFADMLAEHVTSVPMDATRTTAEEAARNVTAKFEKRTKEVRVGSRSSGRYIAVTPSASVKGKVTVAIGDAQGYKVAGFIVPSSELKEFFATVAEEFDAS